MKKAIQVLEAEIKRLEEIDETDWSEFQKRKAYVNRSRYRRAVWLLRKHAVDASANPRINMPETPRIHESRNTIGFCHTCKSADRRDNEFNAKHKGLTQ